jgi:hypothetical protein
MIEEEPRCFVCAVMFSYTLKWIRSVSKELF